MFSTRSDKSGMNYLAILLLVNFIVLSSAHTDLILSDEEASVETEPSSNGNIDIRDDEVFHATSEWQEIRPGQVVPSGLHFRINLQTGKREAKLIDPQEESLKNIDDDAKEHLSSGLRSYQDLQELKAREKLKFNTEFEKVEVLVQHYANSSRENKMAILDDLEFFLHQYDNARDFMTIGGLETIVRTALADRDPEMRAKGAQVFSSCVQSHPDVKEKVLSRQWMPFLLAALKNDQEEIVRKRLIHSVTCLVREHRRSWQEFAKNGGIDLFLELLEDKSVNQAFHLKILTFFSDMFTHNETMNQKVADKANLVCQTIDSFLKTLSKDEIDLVEKVCDILGAFRDLCSSLVVDSSLGIQRFRLVYEELKVRNKEEGLELDHILDKMKSVRQMYRHKSEL